MEKLIKAWFIITLITFMLFKLGETMTSAYTEPAGEGNPYVLVLLSGWPFVLLFIWITVRLARRTVASVNGLARVGLFAGSILMAGIGLYVNFGQASSLRDGIRASENAAYASGWNQFTNIIYANQLTFFVLTVSCMALGIVVSFVTSTKDEEQLK
ncbi:MULTISPECIES: hypothetical protein [unclassified Exiguobacterium]|uniref:hypothetical protein n=1 Tax=unclassified Exiguobacterium TaxID=2644629 RepID=UPI00103E4731|nr:MULTISPECIES: hypothetical protein [unclassified Exiguobacterium]TCI25858.1 hypothetical protein EVJ32_08275 [Exiguobacterium sp. SH5S4]TCI52364.1 hypothetical protein EVJ30_09825 [Exiguobacterium sp. SH5S13]TCI62155.1 hypothetical protein EVJ26_08150 [Exiguobacterium sp. SH3S1]